MDDLLGFAWIWITVLLALMFGGLALRALLEKPWVKYRAPTVAIFGLLSFASPTTGGTHRAPGS